MYAYTVEPAISKIVAMITIPETAYFIINLHMN